MFVHCEFKVANIIQAKEGNLTGKVGLFLFRACLNQLLFPAAAGVSYQLTSPPC